MKSSLEKLSLISILIGAICFLVLYYSGQAYLESKMDTPNIYNGVADMTQWDFSTNKTVKLDGPWAFYWNQLVPPATNEKPTGYLNVPGHWIGDLSGTKLQAKGTATYRLIVKVKPSDMIYGLRIANVQMSSTVYVNGVKLGGSGQPSDARRDYVPENKPYTVYFPIQGDQAEIVVQAANFDFVQGGVVYSIQFGSEDAIKLLDMRTMGVDIVVVVALFMLGLYNSGVYLSRKEEKGFLYFGLYCITAALAFTSLSDKMFMQVMYFLPFSLSYKLQNISIYASVLMVLRFVGTMCSDIVPRWFIRLVTGIFGSFMVFVAAVPFEVYSYFTFIFSLLHAFVYISIIWMLSASYVKGRYGSFNKRSMMILILAFCGLLICLVDNTCYLLSWLPNNYLGNVGIILFSILISLMLSFRFSEAYRTIERMTEKLKEADRLKDEFLANTSHEFQTPLNGIINISESLLEGTGGTINDTQRLNLSVIHAAAGRLSSLVKDILDMEKIKRNELHLSLAPVDIRVTVSVVMEVLQHLVAGKNIRLQNDISDKLPPVMADENRLRQVLYNLIGNAIKFTDSGTVRVNAEEAGGMLNIAVEDTGIGIPREEWRKIFTSFEQGANRSSQEYGGVGLGLSICSQLMRLMNGKIDVEWSEMGQGTRIVFVLPVASGVPINGRFGSDYADILHKIETETGQWNSRQEGGITMLAVDDEASNLQVLSNLFAGKDFHVITASSGPEALQKIQTDRTIDLVLLDVMMPRMSGYEVCRKIRESFTLFDLPVVMLTARNTHRDIAAGFEAGANDFIIKPFNAWEVRARVKTLLELKRSVEEALKSEMAFLQSQIKPHFLFNALNAILSICYTDSKRAAQLISHLSHYLRSSFDIPGTGIFIPLKDELKLVKAYTEIEKARFEERLTLEYDIDETLLDTPFLPLTIQPLVENAIRHGIMKKVEGGMVRLTVKADGDAVWVEVWDSGIGIAAGKMEKLLDHTSTQERRGVGLNNIHRRLVNFFGDGLQIESEEGEWTCITFCSGKSKIKSMVMTG